MPAGLYCFGFGYFSLYGGTATVPRGLPLPQSIRSGVFGTMSRSDLPEGEVSDTMPIWAQAFDVQESTGSDGSKLLAETLSKAVRIIIESISTGTDLVLPPIPYVICADSRTDHPHGSQARSSSILPSQNEHNHILRLFTLTRAFLGANDSQASRLEIWWSGSTEQNTESFNRRGFSVGRRAGSQLEVHTKLLQASCASWRQPIRSRHWLRLCITIRLSRFAG
jgi:hypothetical protein